MNMYISVIIYLIYNYDEYKKSLGAVYFFLKKCQT